MDILQRASETAKVLKISERDALTLEFLASVAWGHVKGDNRAEAIMWLGAAHAAGNIDADTMRRCLDILNA